MDVPGRTEMSAQRPSPSCMRKVRVHASVRWIQLKLSPFWQMSYFEELYNQRVDPAKIMRTLADVHLKELHNQRVDPAKIMSTLADVIL